jgi:hypothetical protein
VNDEYYRAQYLADLIQNTRLPMDNGLDDTQQSLFRKWLAKQMQRGGYAPYTEEGQPKGMEPGQIMDALKQYLQGQR